jgi:hypothetical protein
MKSLALLLVVLASVAVGCGASPQSSATPQAPRAAVVASVDGEHIWRSKCGSCHTPVDPGSHGRDALVDALSRHRKRVRLDPTQWQAVTDFLAPDR